jgi:hypothetical protein
MKPRPTCPECGQAVPPRTAAIYVKDDTIPDKILSGIYCDSDCLLDAYERKYPYHRVEEMRSKT